MSHHRSDKHKERMELRRCATYAWVHLRAEPAQKRVARTIVIMLVAQDGVRSVHDGEFCVAHVARDDCATADVKSVTGTFEAAVSLRGRLSQGLDCRRRRAESDTDAGR